jgi:tetratricopeptide (TPR) repeat protein
VAGTVEQAQGFFLQRDFQAAEAVIEELLEDEPQNVEALALLGSCFLREQRVRDAQRALEQCVSIEPEHYESHLELARVYEFLQDIRLSELHYLIVLSMNAASLEATLGLACLYSASGKHGDAALWFELAWAIHPSDGIGLDLAQEYENCSAYIQAYRVLNTLSTHLNRHKRDQTSRDEVYKHIDVFSSIITQRKQRVNASFQSIYHFTIEQALVMVDVLKRFLTMDSELISAIGREAEMLLLAGEKHLTHRVRLHSLGRLVDRSSLQCYCYAAYQLVEPRRPLIIDLSPVFNFALLQLETEF